MIYDVESLDKAVKEFVREYSEYPEGQGLRVAFYVDEKGEVHLSGLLTSNTFLNPDFYQNVVYVNTYNWKEIQDWDEWFVNEIGGEITEKNVKEIVKELHEDDRLTKEDIQYLEETNYSKNVLQYLHVGTEWFSSDVQKELQEHVLKYWFDHFVYDGDVENYTMMIENHLECCCERSFIL